MMDKIIHDKCIEVIKDAINSEHKESEHKVYAYLDEINIDETGDNSYLSFSLITEKILDFDVEYRTVTGYRPFFLSYVATENIEAFVKKYEESVKENEQLDYVDRWFEISFSDKEPATPIFEFEGYVEYSASPIKYIQKSLKIIATSIPNDVKEKINETYSVSTTDNGDVDYIFRGVFGGASYKKARVYNVGHGNFITVNGKKGKDRFSFIYDIGTHRGRFGAMKTKYSRAKHAIAGCIPNAVILSHWDSDHFMGVVFAKDIIFEKKWFAPDVNDSGTNAKRLACFLDYKGVLVMVEKNDFARVISETDIMKLMMGKNKSTNHITKVNCSGLAFKITTTYNNKKVSRFMGDVPYAALVDASGNNLMKDDIKKNDNLVMPHHGRKMSTDRVDDYHTRGAYGFAIYSNSNEETPHPQDLKKTYNYKVECTKDYPLCCEIDL